MYNIAVAGIKMVSQHNAKSASGFHKNALSPNSTLHVEQP